MLICSVSFNWIRKLLSVHCSARMEISNGNRTADAFITNQSLCFRFQIVVFIFCSSRNLHGFSCVSFYILSFSLLQSTNYICYQDNWINQIWNIIKFIQHSKSTIHCLIKAHSMRCFLRVCTVCWRLLLNNRFDHGIACPSLIQKPLVNWYQRKTNSLETNFMKTTVKNDSPKHNNYEFFRRIHYIVGDVIHCTGIRDDKYGKQ